MMVKIFDNIVVGFLLRLIGPALHYKPIHYSINSIKEVMFTVSSI